jgi:hypothetical protein
VPASILPFDQTDFGMNDTGEAMGFAREGWMYLPSRCKVFHGRHRHLDTTYYIPLMFLY